MTLLDITFGDAEELLIGWLRARPFASSDANLKIDTPVPSVSLSGPARYVQVESAGATLSTRTQEFVTVRLVAWTPKGTRGAVKALASQVRSQALQHPGDDNVFGVFPLTGRSSVVADPDTLNLSCWTTVNVALRPQQH